MALDLLKAKGRRSIGTAGSVAIALVALATLGRVLCVALLILGERPPDIVRLRELAFFVAAHETLVLVRFDELSLGNHGHLLERRNRRNGAGGSQLVAAS